MVKNIPLFCSVCNDVVVAVYPCKFVFHDKIESEFNICLDCMETGTLKINLQRKRQVASVVFAGRLAGTPIAKGLSIGLRGSSILL